MTQLLQRPTLLFTWLFILLVLVLFWLLIYFISAKLRKELHFKIILTSGSFFLTILLLEAVFRFLGVQATPQEKCCGYYDFVMHNTYRDSIFSHSPNSEIELGNRTDFLYPRKTNSLGLSDKEWKVTKDTNTIRIVALGDSFTEGDGAPVDSTWPRFLEQMLVGEALNVEVMNAGVCGSDPFFSISLLKNRLLKYNPDIVIISVSMQDFLEDIAVRGGMDRFDPNNGRLPQFRELLYAYSRIVRLGYTYMGYSWLLINEQSEALLNELTQVKMPELTHEIESIKKAHRNMDVILVLYPHMHQYERGYEEKLEASFKNNIAKAEGVYFVDLMDCYKAEIENSNKDYKSFWWLNDGHHNSDGYLMKATCIKEKVQMTFNAN